MQRPQVRQIENQQVESEREITGYEAEQLLRKYGHSKFNSTMSKEISDSQNDLTFEEMVRLEELRLKNEQDIKRAKTFGPKPTTFSGDNGYNSETKWGQDEESGFGFKINIVSDMKLPE